MVVKQSRCYFFSVQSTILRVQNGLLLLLLLFIYLTLREVKIFAIKNIYIAVAIPLNDRDGMLNKVNEKKNLQRKAKYNEKNKLRIKTLPKRDSEGQWTWQQTILATMTQLSHIHRSNNITVTSQ